MKLLRCLLVCVALAAFSITCITTALHVLRPALTATAYVPATGVHKLDVLPWSFHGASKNDVLSISMPVHWYTPKKWRVLPDDELIAIKVNGQNVPLDSVPDNARKDADKGFEFDFSPWLKPGDNAIAFQINNRDGDGGLSLHPISGIRWVLLWAGFVPWIVLLSRSFKLRSYQTVLITFSLVIICCYWSVTPWTVRAHDVWSIDAHDGHIDYVIRLAHTMTLPAPDERWELFQPPLYYVGGAVVWRWAEFWGLSAPETLQAYSVLLWLLFLAASAALINLAVQFRHHHAAYATVALVLWPTGIITSIAINNDVGLYALSSLAMLYMARWWHSHRPAELLLCALFIALALLTKTTAVVLIATLGLLMLMRLWRHQHWRQWRSWQPMLWSGAVIVTGFALSLGRKILYYQQGRIQDWITGDSNSLLGDWLKVPAKIGNFLPMDVATFISHPWIDLTKDATGRYNFWNVLLRTALTGEYSFNGTLQEWVSVLWGLLLLAILLTLIIKSKRLTSINSSWRHMPLIIVSFMWLASLISFRAHASFACNNDFRYLLPVLVPLAIACSFHRAARNMMALISLGSVIFFLTLQFG